MDSKDHLLIVDDDERLRTLLSEFVENHGFLSSAAETGDQAFELLSCFNFDIIILDVMMPGISGLELAGKIRKSKINTPILFLTALGSTDDKIKGLEMGGDDYLEKPFEPKELLLRIKAILRRTQTKIASTKKEFQIGALFFNTEKNTLRRDDEAIPLTSSEASLLKIFVAHIGEYLSREALIQLMGVEAGSRTIDVQITRLRKKIEDDPKKPRFLQTVRNKGYVLWDH